MEAPVSASVARRFRAADDFNFHRRRAVSADQSHRAELSPAARVAMAGARPMVLDSYAQFSYERPRLRHRMAERAAAAVHTLRSRAVSAEFLPVSAAARIDFQPLDPARRPTARRLAMDVAAPDRLYFFAAGGQRGQ